MRCDGSRSRATICKLLRMEFTPTSWAIRVTSLSVQPTDRTMLASWISRKSTTQTTSCDSTKTSSLLSRPILASDRQFLVKNCFVHLGAKKLFESEFHVSPKIGRAHV